MNVTLKPEMVRYIEDQIAIGRFASPDSMIEAAITEFMHLDNPPLDAQTISAINEGLDQADRGEGVDLDKYRADSWDSIR